MRAALRNGATGVEGDPALGEAVGRAPELPVDRRTRRLDRTAQMFFAASLEAWSHAGLTDATLDKSRCGVIEGSSLGPMAELLETHRRLVLEPGTRVGPTALIRFMTGAGGAAFSQDREVKGPVFHVSAGSVSAMCAIGEAYHKIATGLTDVVLAGGAESPLQSDVVRNFRVAGVLTEDAVCRPFDRRRTGTVLGEGAGAFVLEEADHARRRGAVPLAAITGYGLAAEAFSMISPEPDGRGVACATRQALAAGDGRPVDWIKTHGTGTPSNDAAECNGLAAVFEDDLSDIPLTSLKPMFGHCLGASGAVEGVAAVLALHEGFIPPTIGFDQPDDALPANTVQRTCEESDARRILLLAESFGGRCAALSVERPQ
jgi:3-oxoacyl-[acyl-carrier-protein] synthase II